jgi:hypothetical protein
MPRTGTFLESAISFYSTLAQQSLGAMRDTQEELRTDQFNLSKTVARGASLWLDALEGWWSALLVTASPPVPTVFFHIGANISTDDRRIAAHVPRLPQFTGFYGVQGGGTPPGILIESESQGNGLKFKLKDLSKNPPTPGLYIGLVHLEGTPLATVMVQVDESYKPGK